MRLGKTVAAGVSQMLAISLMLLPDSVHSANAADPRMGFVPPAKADFTAQSWSESFDNAHRKLAAEYAFTDWKNVAWDDLYRRYAPMIAAAERTADRQAYYMALHAYLFSVDDGHLSLPRNAANSDLIHGLIMAQSGGSYGLGLAKLEDGRVIVAALREGGAAQRAGVQSGAEVLALNGGPIDEAIAGVSLGNLVASFHTATDVHRKLEELRLLTRAPVGTSAEWTVRNPSGDAIKSVKLVAVDDHLQDMTLFNLAPNPSDADEAKVIGARMVDGQVGYIRLVAEADLHDLSTYPAAIREQFQSALSELRNKGAKALVLDLRGNHGGFDTLAADLCGMFAGKASVFEKTVFYDQRDGSFLELTYDDRIDDVVEAIHVTPRADGFRGPVAVLVNPRTISSGEGLAKCIADLPQGVSLGFNGTNGSFGIALGEILMPAGLVIHFPNGRSVDVHGNIQIDSRGGVGGVLPEHRVPASFDNMMAYGRGEDVELGEALRVLSKMGR